MHTRRLSFAVLLCFVLAFQPIWAGNEAPAGKPFRILLTNDDGVDAEGIAALAVEMAKIGEITIIAPAVNWSGAGHGLTVKGPILVNEVKKNGQFFGFGAECTPASCVKLAINGLLEEKPDLVVSGINEGFNIGQIIYVSGTFGAAQEAVMAGIPGIAVSLERDKNNQWNYPLAAEFTRTLVEGLKEKGFPTDAVINVNVPSCSHEEFKGGIIATLSRFTYRESWTRRKTPFGKPYFWQTIRRPPTVFPEGSDAWAIDNNFAAVTVVPMIVPTDKDQASLKKLTTVFPPRR